MRDEVQRLLEAAAERVLREHAPESLALVATLVVVPGKTIEHGDFASNAHLRKTYDFVQDLLEERVVYVFDSRGAHRFVTRGEVPRCIAVDPSGLVRSWNGSLDRGGDA